MHRVLVIEEGAGTVKRSLQNDIPKKVVLPIAFILLIAGQISRAYCLLIWNLLPAYCFAIESLSGAYWGAY